MIVMSVAAVFCVTLALLPRQHRLTTSLCVVACIASVELGVIVAMAYLDISLDVVSMICLAICVGFSVDFSAHVAYHYLASTHDKHAIYR